MTQEYIDQQVKEVIPAQRKGGGPGREAFSSGISGPAGEFVYVTLIKSLAQFDAPSPMVRALGQEGAAALGAKVARLAEPMASAPTSQDKTLRWLSPSAGRSAADAVLSNEAGSHKLNGGESTSLDWKSHYSQHSGKGSERTGTSLM